MPWTNLIRWSVWRDFCCHRNCSPKKVVVLSLELPKSPENPENLWQLQLCLTTLPKLSDVFTGLLNGSHLLLWVGIACEHLCKVPKIYCWWLRNPIPNHRKDVETNPVDNEIFTIYQQYLHLSRDPWPMLYLSRSSLPPKFWLGFNCDLERSGGGGNAVKDLDKPDETWDILHMKPCKSVINDSIPGNSASLWPFWDGEFTHVTFCKGCG